MTNNAQKMYDLSIEQCANLIKTVGAKRTVVVTGHTGTGKSSIGKQLARELPSHTFCYFDCTTKDLGDIFIPKVGTAEASDYVSFAPNEEFGIHHGGPVILMIDELGKANPMVKNALLRVMQERQIGAQTLHPDSIVFATTNLGSEGLGDILPAHARNRLCMVRMQKPDHLTWISWGIDNGIDHGLLGWVRDNPQVFQSFEDIGNPDDNPYIFHPRATGRTSFVTPRSLEAASDILKLREFMDDQSVTAALMGTIGDRAAMDMMAYVRLADDLPKLAQIKSDPESAPVPKSIAAQCMVVYRTLASIERDWIDAWMTYLNRMPRECQGMFANGVRTPGYSRQGIVMTNAGFTSWARTNSYLFASDKQ
jgi:energy-coupling factor transporter ATP-binding protein EcfA2